MNFTIEGVAPPPPDQPGIVAWFRVVSPDYLSVMGMRVRSGRLFEGREAQPTLVISNALATRYWPGVDPVGRRVRFGPVGWRVSMVHDRRRRRGRQPTRRTEQRARADVHSVLARGSTGRRADEPGVRDGFTLTMSCANPDTGHARDRSAAAGDECDADDQPDRALVDEPRFWPLSPVPSRCWRCCSPPSVSTV
jgi:hypothetical protein